MYTQRRSRTGHLRDVCLIYTVHTMGLALKPNLEKPNSDHHGWLAQWTRWGPGQSQKSSGLLQRFATASNNSHGGPELETSAKLSVPEWSWN